MYLGIILDHTLTYREHCKKTKGKITSQNNLLHKLCGMNCGAQPQTLCTTVMALCVSTVEYCCPVWSRSAHCKDIDVALNDTCYLITGCICPTHTLDLYVLSGIAPPDIRRQIVTQKEQQKNSDRSQTQPLQPCARHMSSEVETQLNKQHHST